MNPCTGRGDRLHGVPSLPSSQELSRLNDRLSDDLRFWVERTVDGHTAVGRVELARGDDAPEFAVLAMRLPGGRVRRVSCAVPPVAAGRARLLLLASSVAECAMMLGLGTGVYRRGRA